MTTGEPRSVTQLLRTVALTALGSLAVALLVAEWNMRHQLFQNMTAVQQEVRTLRERDADLTQHVQTLETTLVRHDTIQRGLETRIAVLESGLRTLEHRTMQVIERHLAWLEQGTVWCQPLPR